MTNRGAARGQPDQKSRRQLILRLLKQQGASDAEALASQLGISAMAVRQHLYALRSRKLVSFVSQARPMGRPAKMWSLTPAADPLFPDGHADLVVDVLRAARQTLGEAAVDRVVLQCAQQQVEAYRARMPARGSLRSRLTKLQSLRNDEGYMADLRPQPDGSFLLNENHCAISGAARACPKFCDAELMIFRAVLGSGVVVERTEHLIAGARRCVYRIHAARR